MFLFWFWVFLPQSHLHDDADEELVDVVAHARAGLGELEGELHGEVAALGGLEHPAPLQVRLVPHQDGRLARKAVGGGQPAQAPLRVF